MTDSNETEAFEVAGRGELQLGVLIEQMRREGFELTIGRPRVLTQRNPETGERRSPWKRCSLMLMSHTPAWWSRN